MKIEHFHLDAFTTTPFGGNPAAVVPLVSQEIFDSDERLQKLAAEFNMPATAFYLRQANNSSIQIKWFTPSKRIPICGHGTLAASHVLFQTGWEGDSIEFDAGPVGQLTSLRGNDGSITLDFPACYLVDLKDAGQMLKGGVDLKEVIKAALPPDAQFTIAGRGDRGGYVDMLVVELQEGYPLREMKYNPQPLQILYPEIRGLTFTTRSIADPNFHIHSRCVYSEPTGEDFVTGSAHCMLAAHWFNKLGLEPGVGELQAAQVSSRGGSMTVIWKKEEMRCLIRSKAVILGKGEWSVDL